MHAVALWCSCGAVTCKHRGVSDVLRSVYRDVVAVAVVVAGSLPLSNGLMLFLGALALLLIGVVVLLMSTVALEMRWCCCRKVLAAAC